MEAVGINGCQGTPWSEELDGKELHGAASWLVRSGVERNIFSCIASQRQHINFTSILNMILCWF